MTAPHPLDRPIWHALNGRQAALGEGGVLARRFAPNINFFAAAADNGLAAQAALSALVVPGGQIGLVEAAPPPLLPGTRVTLQTTLYQMLLDTPLPADDHAVDWIPLGQGDAADMLALAQLTRPGPFFARTGLMGDFVGIRRGGTLIAMTGERFKPDGFTEISAVCTHPDWRGQGYGVALMRVILGRIRSRGETAFLHVYPDNPATALYRALRFSVRREMIFTIVER